MSSMEVLLAEQDYRLLCTSVKRDEGLRLSLLKDAPEKLSKSQRRDGLIPGVKLVPEYLDFSDNAPAVALGDLTICEFGCAKKLLDRGNLGERIAVEINLENMDDIYVVDLTDADDFKKSVMTVDVSNNHLEGQDLWDYWNIVLSTVIPISEYKGNYKKPKVLVARELVVDELEIEYDIKKDIRTGKSNRRPADK